MNTTTSFFQKYPDFFNSKEECDKFIKNYNKEISNPRYKNFKQTHFTAGDEEQFKKYCLCKNGKENKVELSSDNLFYENVNDINSSKSINWDKYKNLNPLSVLNTFKYMFYKFKKGIFVKIIDNELKVFLPFSNVNFVNEWSDKIKIDPKYKDMYDFFKHINDMDGRSFNKHYINKFKNCWYSNNCLVRYEFPVNEGDTNVSSIKNMLEELCNNRNVPDIEFFINRRDFPMLSKDSYEPYYHLWDSFNKPLISHNYGKYSPILSMSSSPNYADIICPTYEDWNRVQHKENKWFPRSRQEYNYIFDILWENKKNIAVFRGSSTGEGVTIDDNQRLKLVYISNQNDNNKYIDAGITRWNIRPKKLFGKKYLQTLEIDKLPFTLSNKLDPKEQSAYKYIIHVDGHVSAFRLSYTLSMNSVVLLVESDWKAWYSNLIKPYIHYIPIKKDMSDLLDKIIWCQNNDLECKNITSNALEFYNKYLQKDGIFDYFQQLLINLKKQTGIYKYNETSIKEIQLALEKKQIEKQTKYILNNTVLYDDNQTYNLSIYPRSYETFKNINNIINSLILNKKFVNFQNETVIFKNKYGFIKKYNFYDINIINKITKDEGKAEEHLHEYFVGINCINKLLKEVPNFIYIYGMFYEDENINIITEYIEGVTLQEYITSEDFELNNYFLIIIQICLAIEIAQEKYCFMHCDLTPWNILIKYYKNPVNIEYNINNKIYSIKTNYVPIIIDYGKSHFIYKNLHYGIINIYNYTKNFDLFTLFITSAHEISIHKNLNNYDYNMFLKYINFLQYSKLCSKNFENYKDVKTFLHFSKKYCNLINVINSYKYDSRPLDLVNYIISISDIKLEYKYNFNNIMEFAPYSLINKLIYTDTVKETIKIYLNYFKDVQNMDLSELDNLSKIYILQKVFNDTINVYDFFVKFINKENVLTEIKKYNNMYEKTLKYLNDNFKVVNNKLDLSDIKYIHYINIKKNEDNKDKIESYDESIFLFPEKVKDLLNKFESKNYDIKTKLDIKISMKIIDIIKYIIFNNTKLQISIKNKYILTKVVSEYDRENILLNNTNLYSLIKMAKLIDNKK